MNKSRRVSILAVFATCCFTASLAATGPSVLAADDTTPPVLQLPGRASFITGTQLSDMQRDVDGYVTTSGLPMDVRWRALDESGICGYKVAGVDGWGDPVPWRRLPWYPDTRFETDTDDYVDQQGGGAEDVSTYAVRAYDCAGNHKTRQSDFSPYVYQETGESYGWGDLDITYSGSWALSNCACWSGGTTQKTYQAGAAAEFNVAAQQLGIVMETAPDRGQAQIWIDGQLRATVNTYAATTQHRVVVWSGKLGRYSTHDVRIVNVGTTGRSRIDLDAIVAN
jgi:hypothetical protein